MRLGPGFSHYGLRWSLAFGPHPDVWVYLRIGARYWQVGAWYIEWGPHPAEHKPITTFGYYLGHWYSGVGDGD